MKFLKRPDGTILVKIDYRVFIAVLALTAVLIVGPPAWPSFLPSFWPAKITRIAGKGAKKGRLGKVFPTVLVEKPRHRA
jgi:hypothetical protein